MISRQIYVNIDLHTNVDILTQVQVEINDRKIDRLTVSRRTVSLSILCTVIFEPPEQCMAQGGGSKAFL